jgi:dipeptidyl aminopeptidase/acylaminoacyl peptidase
MRRFLVAVLLLCGCPVAGVAQTQKPKLTLDDFFESVYLAGVKVSPDGNSVLIATEKPDWQQQTYRRELWLYRISGDSGTLERLTQSGRETGPQWSPDGRQVAFFCEQKVRPGKKAKPTEDSEIGQLCVIDPATRKTTPLTFGSEGVHAFSWSPDSKSIYFVTRQPWSRRQMDEHEKAWKDVVRFRGDERGDAVLRLNLADGLAHQDASSGKDVGEDGRNRRAEVARVPFRIDQISASPDGKRLALLSNSISQREETGDEIEIYLVNLSSGATPAAAARLTDNHALEADVEWSPDSRHVFFRTILGSAEGKYRNPQARLYWVDADSGSVERWFAAFPGEVEQCVPVADGSVLCAGGAGTEVQIYSQANPQAPIVKREGWAGTYESLSAAAHSPRVAFTYSAIERPAEIYIAESPDRVSRARAITAFNKLFTERDLPRAKPYRWTSDDGTSVEGMLMYPPGKFEAKNLPMFVYIKGGPDGADGNHFEADWYQWDRLAATQGWLVFEPNYRGSTRYGDDFSLQIASVLFSRPGRDILSGIDALVKDGIADSNRLAVGGYSYGGFLTNWLITQTTRFKAAVTGAGGVENVAGWGNDDTTGDDTYVLGGAPWEARERYASEAAIFQIDKVRTPTLIVSGDEDGRVPILESYLLERALHRLGIPSEFLIFPGEGHEFDKNPWHAKIMVREELNWLSKYGGVGEPVAP